MTINTFAFITYKMEIFPQFLRVFFNSAETFRNLSDSVVDSVFHLSHVVHEFLWTWMYLNLICKKRAMKFKFFYFSKFWKMRDLSKVSIFIFLHRLHFLYWTPLICTCSKSTIETLKNDVVLVWYFGCYLWTYFTPFSSVSTVGFEQVNASWEVFLSSRALWKDIHMTFYVNKINFDRVFYSRNIIKKISIWRFPTTPKRYNYFWEQSSLISSCYSISC